MREDAEGFLQPGIDPDKCIECELCMVICPVLAVKPVESLEIGTVYAGWTTDRELLASSTSGGVFSELARNVLDQGGVVFGAAYDEHMVVRHVAIESWEDLDRLRGSKYVQSAIGETFSQARECIEAGRRVLFSGTPCQIAGLRAAFEGEHDHELLLTCDVVCHGVPSPKVFRMYIESLEKKYGSRISQFYFRDKRQSWRQPTIVFETENGRTKALAPADVSYCLSFYKDIDLRPACHSCAAKEGAHNADITMGDFWGLYEFKPELINPEGTSVVVVNSEKGKAALDACGDRLSLTEAGREHLEENNTLRRCVEPHARREDFFQDIDKLSYDELAKKYMPPRKAAKRILANVRRRFLKIMQNRKES